MPAVHRYFPLAQRDDCAIIVTDVTVRSLPVIGLWAARDRGSLAELCKYDRMGMNLLQ